MIDHLSHTGVASRLLIDWFLKEIKEAVSFQEDSGNSSPNRLFNGFGWANFISGMKQLDIFAQFKLIINTLNV